MVYAALDMENGDGEGNKGMDEMPQELQDLFREHGKIFAHNLTREKKIDTEPIKLILDPNRVPAPRATVCRRIPAHWKESGNKVIDLLIQQGLLYAVYQVCEFVSPSFFVAKGNDPLAIPRLVFGID